MIKATLKQIKTRTKMKVVGLDFPGLPDAGDIIRTKTEEIELPDVVDTGDIINAITKATRIFDYDDYMDYMDSDIFEIALENGTVYYCYKLFFDKYRLYEYWIDEEGEEVIWLADFRL